MQYKIVKIKIKLPKRGVIRVISHIDFRRVFQRAARRASVPVKLSDGFHPHPKISVQPALKLGIEGKDLEAIFKLDCDMGLKDFRSRLENELPAEIFVEYIEEIP